MGRKEELVVLIAAQRQKLLKTAGEIAALSDPNDDNFIKNLDRENHILHNYIEEYKKLA